MKKPTIRQQIKTQRASLSKAEITILSSKICQHLPTTKLWQQTKTIAAYISHNGEVSPNHLLTTALADNKICYLPALTNENHLEFREYHATSILQKNKFGIPEPQTNAAQLSATDLDLVLVPLVAFDKNCNRLGQGKAYYDRTFAFKQENKTSKPFLIGLAYEFQFVDELETQAWDIPLNAIITEQNIYGELQ